jgi:hypothetical protein
MKKIKIPKCHSHSFLLFFVFLFFIFLFFILRFFLSFPFTTFKESFIGGNGSGLNIHTSSSVWCDQNMYSSNQCKDIPNTSTPYLEIKKKENEPLTDGICLTEDGKWGVQLKRYGRKCISMDMIKNKQNNILLNLEEGESKTKQSTQSIKANIMGTIGGVNLDTLTNSSSSNETDCFDSSTNTDFEAICRYKTNNLQGLKEIVDCSNSNKKKGICNPNYYQTVEITPTTSQCLNNSIDKINTCQTMLNTPIGYPAKIRKGSSGGCYQCNPNTQICTENKNEYRVICTDGPEVKENQTRCMNWNTNFNEECNSHMISKGNENGGIVVSTILSNCIFGERRGVCEKK